MSVDGCASERGGGILDCNCNIYYIYYYKDLMLHKDLRMCVTGVMHEHSFMQIESVIYIIYIN